MGDHAVLLEKVSRYTRWIENGEKVILRLHLKILIKL